ncbi:MAG: hypothetical protein GX456_01675 [Verrucomicrobia bacterium]|nr:hypothetical protein [Verrucomicrobiota bacterium]
MINTLRIYEELSEVMDPRPAQKLASVLGLIYEDLQDTVKRSDFEALQRVVSELAVSQKELAEAQKRTEARVEELSAAQKQTEIRLGELAEAQKRTETRVEELTRSLNELSEAQKSTEIRLGELAAAQQRTESALAKLAERLDDTNKQLGGLAITVGYTLENEAYRALPVLLERDHQVKLTEPLRRDYLADARGRDLEVNILGRGTRGSEPVWIIGEAKAQLSKNEVDRFIRNRVEPLKAVCGKVFPILVAHMVSSRDVPEYARQRGVALYLSYQFGQQ